jgi:hypothetical protein
MKADASLFKWIKVDPEPQLETLDGWLTASYGWLAG